MDVNEVLLPGVGLRYEFTTHAGDRISVVAWRTGEFEVIGYVGDDPDEGSPLFRLNEDEAEALAQIFGAPRIAERFADLTREVPGLESEPVKVGPSSSYVNRPLGHTRARTRTGASVVAIVRGADVIASPNPDQVLRPADVLVVVGTREGIDGVKRIIQG